MFTAIAENGLALSDASEALQNDKDIVLAALTQNGLALEYASDALREDREVVLAAIRQNGWALQYANDSLRADPEVRIAAELNGYGHLLLSPEMRAIYSDSSHFLNFDDDSSAAYKYFTSEDPLCLLCHFDSVDAEGDDRYEMQFNILKQAYDSQWLILAWLGGLPILRITTLKCKIISIICFRGIKVYKILKA